MWTRLIPAAFALSILSTTAFAKVYSCVIDKCYYDRRPSTCAYNLIEIDKAEGTVKTIRSEGNTLEQCKEKLKEFGQGQSEASNATCKPTRGQWKCVSFSKQLASLGTIQDPILEIARARSQMACVENAKAKGFQLSDGIRLCPLPQKEDCQLFAAAPAASPKR